MPKHSLLKLRLPLHSQSVRLLICLIEGPWDLPTVQLHFKLSKTIFKAAVLTVLVLNYMGLLYKSVIVDMLNKV